VKDTIITSFPADDSNATPDTQNAYQCILEGAGKCTNVWDLHSLMIKEVMGYMFNQNNKNFQDLIATYRWVTRKKVIGIGASSRVLCTK
jgi:hypothetical protein